MSKGKKKKNKAHAQAKHSVSAKLHSSVLQSIRRHARSQPDLEICGVLVGKQAETETIVVGAVAAEDTAQGESHVTFTQESWVKIHNEREKRFPGYSVVGWYHSHPGFGVFLSDHDLFIHKNFFSDKSQLAWVFDPHSDAEGLFGWRGDDVSRMSGFQVVTDSDDDTAQKDPNATAVTAGPESLHPMMSDDTLLMLAISALIGIVLAIIFLLFRANLASHMEERRRLGLGPNQPPVEEQAAEAKAESKGKSIPKEGPARGN